jgi:predicted NAD/FAD-dependent oxidoreductase
MDHFAAPGAGVAGFAACVLAAADCRLVMVDDGGRGAGFALGAPPSLLRKSPNEDLDLTACTFAIRLS